MLYIIEVWSDFSLREKAHVVGSEEQAREIYQEIRDEQAEDINGGLVILFRQMQDELILLEGLDKL